MQEITDTQFKKHMVPHALEVALFGVQTCVLFEARTMPLPCQVMIAKCSMEQASSVLFSVMTTNHDWLSNFANPISDHTSHLKVLN